EGYPDACRRMLESVYPQDLREAIPPPDVDRDAAERWFMRETGVGQSSAREVARLYELIARADPSQREGQDPESRGRRPVRPATPRESRAVDRSRREELAVKPRTADGESGTALSDEAEPNPSVHIDIQVH